MSDTDIAWAAGVLEGEGSFSLCGGNSIRVMCTMTDIDILERLQKIFGGKIASIRKREEHWKDAWAWTIFADDALTCMRSILPYMGVRRSEKINMLITHRESFIRKHKNTRKLFELAGKEHATTSKSTRQVAKEFGVTQTVVCRYSKKYRQTYPVRSIGKDSGL